MLQLQRNVPPPARRREPHGNKKYPFELMTEVGHFFFVPGKRWGSIRTYFSTEGPKHGIKLRSEQIYARQDEHGLWEPCTQDTPGATDGVGVWRIE